MPITLVTGQVAVNEAGSALTITTALPNNPATGNLVVALYSTGNSAPGTITVKDSANNTYTATTHSPFLNTGSTHGGAPNSVGCNYLLSAPANATKSITLTLTGTLSTLDLWLAEFTGGVFSFDKDATGVDAGASTTCNIPTLTPTNANELLVATNFLSGGTTSANSPWTEISTVPASGAGAEYVIKTDSAAQAVGWTVTSSTWAAISAAFFLPGILPAYGQSIFRIKRPAWRRVVENILPPVPAWTRSSSGKLITPRRRLLRAA